MTWWSRIVGDRQPRKREDGGRRRSIYAGAPGPREKPSVVVSDGNVVGFLVDGKFVAADGRCCIDPASCQRDECWQSWPPRPQPPWWLR